MEPFPAVLADVSSQLRQRSAGMRPWRALGMVRREEFEGPDYQFVSPPFPGHEPILEGRIHELELQPGLWLHCAEVMDLRSMASRVCLEPGLRLVMVLAGELDVSIGHERLHLIAGNASAAVVAMPEPAMFERRWKCGKWERKLSLHFTPAWLRDHAEMCNEGKAPGPSLFGCVLPVPGHGETLGIAPWSPSPRAVSLAEQLILDADSSASGLLRLRQASRALEILYEALAGRQASASSPPETAGLRIRDHERMLRLRASLDTEIRQPYVQPLSLEELGRSFGMSISALQRQFRAAFSVSINEYRRSMRLQQARAELERGSSIAAVAERAGYTSAANFSTAFRRHFGISPGSVRSRP